ncbi:MAG: hypothetical protein QXJ75_05605 [Candidatus Bathyarchaeia archaeon]
MEGEVLSQVWRRFREWFTGGEAGNLHTRSTGRVAGLPNLWGRGQKAPFSFQTCYARYETVGVVTAAIDATVEMIVGPGYHTEAEDWEAKKVVDEFAEEVNLDGLLMDAVLDCAICGNAWIEKVYEDGMLVDLNYLDPLTMEQSVVLHKAPNSLNLYYNGVESYVQVINGQKVATWPREDIIHLTWRRIHNSPYGMGMIRPVENYLATIVDAEEDMGKIIKRYAVPKVAWMLENASKTTFDDVKAQLRSVEPDEDYVIATLKPTTIKTEVVQIDPRARFEYFFNHLLNAIMAGLECPITFLFRGDVRVSDASANAMLQAFDRKIRMHQRRIKRAVEAELFRPLVKQHGHAEVPRMVWGPVEVEKIEDKIRRWIGLLNADVMLTQNTRHDLENELRKGMGLEPLPTAPQQTKQAMDEPTLDGS